MSFYISGPITGQPQKNAEAFSAAKEKLIRDGHKAINPLELDIEKCLPQIDGYDSNYLLVLRACIAELTKCDKLLLLKDWELSRGARLEVTLALGLDMPLYFYNADDQLEELPTDFTVQLLPLIHSCYWNE